MSTVVSVKDYINIERRAGYKTLSYIGDRTDFYSDQVVDFSKVEIQNTGRWQWISGLGI